MKEIASRLIGDTRDGSLQAIKEIADRLDGKPAQTVELDAHLATKTLPEQWLADLRWAIAAWILKDNIGLMRDVDQR